ncbi:Retrovirus-related Pol polyprotein from transposon 17.6, partial [Mucuna pruriens]
MSFGLKNARATYQRAMVTLFHDMMHKEVEVYMDDMIAKSRMSDQHVEDLRKLFERLRLNSAKCTFRVKTGKLLGFIVNERGIEVDLDKVKATQKIPPPRTETEVRVPRNTSRPRPNNTREAPNPLPDNVGRINGLRSGVARRLRKESTGHILSQQEIHKLGTKIPNAGLNLLRSSLDGKKAEIVHASPHYVVHSQDGPPKYIFEKPALTRRIACWQYLRKTNTNKAKKGSTLAKQLTYHPLTDYQLLLHEFPDEHIMLVEETGPRSELVRWKL